MRDQLDEAGIEYAYETQRLEFTQPEKQRKYTPDFVLTTRTGKTLFVETKGEFDVADRMKHLWVRAAHPNIDLRFVFSRSLSPIRKGSKTTYADWCQKHEFRYADKLIPKEWLDE